MINILVPAISPRLQYITEVIFRQFSGLDYKLIENREEFLNKEGEKINYTSGFISGIPWIIPQGILFEKEIHSIDITTDVFKGIPVLFPTKDDRAMLPFDVFTAVFFMISRYEEYLPFKADHYGRFPATESLAYKNNFLSIPVVDYWVNFLTSHIDKRQFSLCSTLDIDVAYAYKHKGFKRNTGGGIQSLLKGDVNGFLERFKVLTGLQQDPYDTYKYIQTIHEKYNIRPQFFILFADYGPNDKNLKVTKKSFHKLIYHLNQVGNIGIHPSFASAKEPAKIKTEIEALSKVIGEKVSKSRQHFLLLSLPGTYRTLIKYGIEEDYTMGFADQPGFRAGTCTPFPFYNLEEEKMTNLRLVPFAFMEGTLRDYLDCSTGQADGIIKSLVEEVRKVNGIFTTLWHNESLSDKKRWKGWRKVYENMMEEIYSVK